MRIFLSIALIINCMLLSGQQLMQSETVSGSSRFGNTEKKELSRLYALYPGGSSLSYDLIRGREFFPYYLHSVSTPVLFYGEKYSCAVISDGNLYKDIFLEYDTYKDRVIYIDTCGQFKNSSVLLLCNSGSIDGFELYKGGDTLKFSFLDSGIVPGFNLSKGFYEVVYDGSSKYLIRHISYTYDVKAVREYNYSPEKYISTGSGFVKFRTTGQFLRAFGDKSGYIREYLRNNGINIRKAGKSEIVSVLRYYDGLGK